LRGNDKTIMELLLDLDNLDDLSPDIDGNEKERRMASLNSIHNRTKSFFNIPDKDDGDYGNDGYGEDNGDSDGDNEKNKNTAVLMLTRCYRSVRPTIRDGEGNKGNGDEGDGDEGL